MQGRAEERQYAEALARMGALALPTALGLASGMLAALVFCTRIGWF